ncbi:MAG: hypothetical protein ACK5VI_10900 [Opitutia bacterium]|jgi:hypothetical protein
MFSKIGRWAAGRVQGSQGVQKYDNWMQRNPWASTALDVGGGLALAAATGGVGGAMAAKGGTIGKVGSALVKGSKVASRMGVMPGGGYTPGGGGSSGSAGGGEMGDLARRRQAALDRLEQQSNQGPPALANDPAAGIQYTPPTAGPRNTDLFDRATAMSRPSGAIQNDAMTEMRGRGQFSYRDRPMAQMNGDPLQEIRNFRGRAGDIAERFAMGGYAGVNGGSLPTVGAERISSRDVKAMEERARVDELMAFDPTASFERYMTGANSRMMDTLKQSNERLTNSAAGGGRLNTGFFDLDAGELGRQVRQDFSNDLSARALDTNQQKLNAITSGSQIRASDLNSLRDQYLQGEMSNQRSSLDAAKANQSASLEAALANQKASLADMDFRASALRELSGADDLRLKAMNDARGYMMDDRDFTNKNYENDRNFGRDTFNDYNDRLQTIGNTQRDDRDFANKNFDTDRNWLLDADKMRQGNYENDRDFGMKRWQSEADMRFKGGDLARQDRDWETGYRNDSTERYLDFLSGTSDRAQGAENARLAASAQRTASRNQMFGQLGGQAMAFGLDYLRNRRGRGTTTTIPVGRRPATAPGPIQINNGSVGIPT